MNMNSPLANDEYRSIFMNTSRGLYLFLMIIPRAKTSDFGLQRLRDTTLP